MTFNTLGFPRFIVSKVLNHASDTGNSAAVTSVYDRNEYLPEKRHALDAWALRLQEIVKDYASPAAMHEDLVAQQELISSHISETAEVVS